MKDWKQHTLNILKNAAVFAVMLIVIFAVLVIPVNRARKAQFTVDALGLYIESYQVLYQTNIDSIEDLPDFHLISRSEGFQLKSSDLKSGYFGGYIYDFESLGKGKYVISASPLGLFSPQKEFGITHERKLKENSVDVDGKPDSFEEIQKWQEIPRSKSIRTNWKPEY